MQEQPVQESKSEETKSEEVQHSVNEISTKLSDFPNSFTSGNLYKTPEDRHAAAIIAFDILELAGSNVPADEKDTLLIGKEALANGKGGLDAKNVDYQQFISNLIHLSPETNIASLEQIANYITHAQASGSTIDSDFIASKLGVQKQIVEDALASHSTDQHVTAEHKLLKTHYSAYRKVVGSKLPSSNYNSEEKMVMYQTTAEHQSNIKEILGETVYNELLHQFNSDISEETKKDYKNVVKTDWHSITKTALGIAGKGIKAAGYANWALQLGRIAAGSASAVTGLGVNGLVNTVKYVLGQQGAAESVLRTLFGNTEAFHEAAQRTGEGIEAVAASIGESANETVPLTIEYIRKKAKEESGDHEMKLALQSKLDLLEEENVKISNENRERLPSGAIKREAESKYQKWQNDKNALNIVDKEVDNIIAKVNRHGVNALNHISSIAGSMQLKEMAKVSDNPDAMKKIHKAYMKWLNDQNLYRSQSDPAARTWAIRMKYALADLQDKISAAKTKAYQKKSQYPDLHGPQPVKSTQAPINKATTAEENWLAYHSVTKSGEPQSVPQVKATSGPKRVAPQRVAPQAVAPTSQNAPVNIEQGGSSKRNVEAVVDKYISLFESHKEPFKELNEFVSHKNHQRAVEGWIAEANIEKLNEDEENYPTIHDKIIKNISRTRPDLILKYLSHHK